jgi:hypothetical protein
MPCMVKQVFNLQPKSCCGLLILIVVDSMYYVDAADHDMCYIQV